MSEFHIGHLELDSPFGNAGGVVKHTEDVDKIAHTGVGWIEAGSYALEARAGNGAHGEVVYYHNPVTGETFNSLGMPGKGIDVVEKEIPTMSEIAKRFAKPLVVNVAPVSNEPAEESRELAARAYEAGADAVLVNAGCPNVVLPDGGRHEILSHNADALNTVLRGLSQVTERFKPVFIRLSPFDTYDQMQRIMETVKLSGVVGAVFTPNTWPDHRPLDEEQKPILEVPGGIGGKSGPATAAQAMRQTACAEHYLYGSGIDVVSSGGIMTGKELARRSIVNPGGTGAGTTFFYESGDWQHDVDKLLWEYQENKPA